MTVWQVLLTLPIDEYVTIKDGEQVLTCCMPCSDALMLPLHIQRYVKREITSIHARNINTIEIRLREDKYNGTANGKRVKVRRKQNSNK